MRQILWPTFSFGGLLGCVQDEKKVRYRTVCCTGNNPTPWVDVEEILSAEAAI